MSFCLLLQQTGLIPHNVQLGRQHKHSNNHLLLSKIMTVQVQCLQQVTLPMCLQNMSAPFHKHYTELHLTETTRRVGAEL
jgi:hypothetical protein